MDIKELIAQDRLVKVTAADYNGKNFDGAPLMPAREGGNMDWIAAVHLQIEARGSTDYAWFGVRGEGVDLTWAGPGDYLFDTQNQHYPVAVIPRLFMEALMAESKMKASLPVLARSTKAGYYNYDNRTYSENEIKILVRLAKGTATPLELHGALGGVTQNTIVKGLGNLRVGGLVREGETSGFSRTITAKGMLLLGSNPAILPGT